MRRRGTRRSVRYTSVLLLLAIAAISMGYATWSNSLTINATASTGTMQMIWKNGMFDIGCFEDSDGPGGPAWVQSYRDSGDLSTAHFKITNGYPGYSAYCTFKYRNDGTIPTRVTTLDVNEITVGSDESRSFDLMGDTQHDLLINLTSGPLSVYDVGSAAQGGLAGLVVTVLDGAPMGQDVTFTAHVNFVQAVGP